MKPQTPGTIAHPSPRKSHSKKETHRPPSKKHKLAPPPFFDTSSVYSDILSDERWFDSSDDEEYVPGEGEDEEVEVEEIVSDHEGEDDNEEGEDEFDDEYYESCSSADEESGDDSDEESTVDPSASEAEATPASTPAISTPLPQTPLPETPSITTPFAQEGITTTTSGEDHPQSNSENDTDDVISKRTRAHHSLVDVELEELEKYLYLQTSPCGSPVEFDEPLRAVEYQNFLASLQIDELDPVLLDDDNDADFDYVAELTQAKEIEEQDEYRNDRAVQVSKKEIDELIKGQELELAAMETTGQTKRRRKTRSSTKEANQNRLGPLKAIRPFSDATKPSYVFAQPQLQQLQKQIADHVQLLLQIYLYARREQNTDCTQQCWDLLTDLATRREEGMKEQPLLFSGSTPEELENTPGIENAKPSHVLFYTHVLDQMDNLKQLVEADENPTVKSSEIITEVFGETFNPELKLIPSNQPAGSRLMFTPAEDSLLALGLEKHGASNWESIIKDYLPSKTAANIANRVKNMTSRRAADNPIKAYKNARKVPLTPHEEILLQQGLRMYGDNWDLISKHMMPHRAGHVLKKNYDDMLKKRANDIAAAAASAAALSKAIPIAPQPITPPAPTIAVSPATSTAAPSVAKKSPPTLTANPLPILPRPLVALAPVPIPKLTPSQYNPQLTPVAVPVIVPNPPSATSTSTTPTLIPAPSAPTTTSTAAATTTKGSKNNNSGRTVRVNLKASGRKKRSDSDATTKSGKPKSSTSNANRVPLKPLLPNIAQNGVNQNTINQNGISQNGPPTPINEVSRYFSLLFHLYQPQVTPTSYNNTHALDAPHTYPYYPTVPQNQTMQEYDTGMYVPETNDLNFMDAHIDIRSSTNSNDSDEFEFEDLDSDTEFDVDAMGDVEDAMAHPANLPPLTMDNPLPPSSPTPSDPPFPFQSPHLPFTPNTPTTPSATNTPRTPLTSPLGALNIFSLDILSTSPATPSATPTKSANSTPTPTKMISPDRMISPGRVTITPPSTVTKSSPIAINLATKFTSLPASPNFSPASVTTSPLKLSQTITPPSADLSPPSTQSSTPEPSLNLLNPPNPSSDSASPSDTAANSPATPLPSSQPSPIPNPPSDLTSNSSPNPNLVTAVSTPISLPKTPPTSHADAQPTTSQLSSGQSATGLSPPTVPVTPPTPTGISETTPQSAASVSVVPSSPTTSTSPPQSSEKDISANNRVVLECGGTLVWSKDEDRAILLAAKSKQATETFMDCWVRQVMAGQLTKTPAQIEKRYEQLLQLLQLYNAKSGKPASLPMSKA